MSEQKTLQVSDLSEGEVDNDVGQTALEEWDNQAKWLPDGFSNDASVNSTELVVCERQIDRSIVATEHTEDLELSQKEYRSQRDRLHSEQEYKNREGHVPQGGEWESGTLVYKVPDTHRETNCSECSGSGRLPCRNCGSTGSVHCPDCGGTGRQETERKCPRCGGSGLYDKEREIQCGQCAGKGVEIVDDKCMQCRGTGDVSCPDCGGGGQLTCQICDGEGLTHKLEVLYRECEPEKAVEHTTYGVPEEFVEDADGSHINTRDGETNLKRPKHEIETRHVAVLKVDYTYEDQPLLADGGVEKEYSTYYIEGEFKKNDYPKSQTRKILPIVGAISLIVLAIVAYVMFM